MSTWSQLRKQLPFLFALICLSCTGRGLAQASVDTYQYDVHGRLTQVQTGAGAKVSYSLDPTDNRANVTVQRQFDTNSSAESWEAESLPHATGFAQFAGWAASVSNSPGAMTYGPYTPSVPAGSHTAAWRILIDNITGTPTDNVVTLDVNDPELNQVLTSRTLTRSMFAAALAYQVFELPFTTTAANAGHHLEFRTIYLGNAYINVDKVSRY